MTGLQAHKSLVGAGEVFGEFATNLQYREARARYRFALPHVSGKRVLDVGCGARGGPVLLAESAAWVIGTDIEPAAIAEAELRFAHPRVRYATMPAERLTLPDGSVDVVTCFEVLEHVEDPSQAVREIRRVLAPGGVVICSSPNALWWSPDGRPLNPHHHREWTAEEFAALLGTGFPHVELHGERRGPAVTGALKPAIRAVKWLDPLGVRRRVPAWLKDVVSRVVFLAGGAKAIPELREEDFIIHPGVELDDEYLLVVCRG